MEDFRCIVLYCLVSEAPCICESRCVRPLVCRYVPDSGKKCYTQGIGIRLLDNLAVDKECLKIQLYENDKSYMILLLYIYGCFF